MRRAATAVRRPLRHRVAASPPRPGRAGDLVREVVGRKPAGDAADRAAPRARRERRADAQAGRARAAPADGRRPRPAGRGAADLETVWRRASSPTRRRRGSAARRSRLRDADPRSTSSPSSAAARSTRSTAEEVEAFIRTQLRAGQLAQDGRRSTSASSPRCTATRSSGGSPGRTRSSSPTGRGSSGPTRTSAT